MVVFFTPSKNFFSIGNKRFEESIQGKLNEWAKVQSRKCQASEFQFAYRVIWDVWISQITIVIKELTRFKEKKNHNIRKELNQKIKVRKGEILRKILGKKVQRHKGLNIWGKTTQWFCTTLAPGQVSMNELLLLTDFWLNHCSLASSCLQCNKASIVWKGCVTIKG